MASEPISFANKQATGLQELAGAPGVAVNVIVDDTGAVRRRPGIQASPSVYSGVVEAAGLTGLYGTEDGAVYAVGSTPQYRDIYKLGPASYTMVSIPLSDATLDGNLRPTFAETQLILAMAGGGKMQKVVLATGIPSRLGGDPPYASHVVANSSRLLGNMANVFQNNSNNYDKSVVRFSDIANGNASYAGMEVWTEGLGTAGHFSAEADPDPVQAIYENTNEVFCFGDGSVQVFAPDPTAVYGPTVTRELGIAAPYSVIKVNQRFAWFDSLRRFVLSDGRSEDVISGPISKTLDDMGDVSDCFGYRVCMGFLDALVWTFPTDGRTFAFQQGSGWSEWLGWDPGLNNFKQFPVTASHSPTSPHDVLVAAGGRVGRFNLDETTDYGELINARVDSGYIAHGTDERKHCKCVRVALRRGQTTAAVGPQALLSWRDKPGPFGAPLVIDLGAPGDTEIVLEFRSLGVYRRRQWRFEFSGTEALELASVIEDYDVLST